MTSACDQYGTIHTCGSALPYTGLDLGAFIIIGIIIVVAGLLARCSGRRPL